MARQTPATRHELTPPAARDLRLTHLAGRRHRVIRTDQLLDLGLSRSSIARREQRGLLRRLHHGVYAVGPGALTAYGAWLAAVDAAGQAALLAAPSAAALWDLERRRPGSIHVVRPTNGTRRLRGVVIHRTRALPPEDRAVRVQIPVTSLARTLLDLAAYRDVAELESAIEAAEREGLDFAQLEAVLARSSGHLGAGKIRQILGYYSEPADLRSRLEQDFRALLRKSKLPLPHFNVVVEGQLVDAYWPEARLVIELDGRGYHGTKRAFQRDRTRTNALQQAGYTALRFTWGDIHDDPLATAAILQDLVCR